MGILLRRENAQPLSWFLDRLGGSTVLGAFCNAELVAIAGFAVQQGQKREHKGIFGACTFDMPQGRPRSVAGSSKRYVISHVNRLSLSTHRRAGQ